MIISQISKGSFSDHFEKYWQKTSDKMDINFIKMFRLGPEVSLRGSPTVSPTTAALWISLPLFTTDPICRISPASMYFFALSQAPPVLEAEIAIWTPLTIAPGRNPMSALGPNKKPSRKGVTVTCIKIDLRVDQA